MGNKKSKDQVSITNQNMEKKKIYSLSRKVWQMYLQVGFTGLLIAATLWYVMSTSARITKQYSPLIDAAMEIKLEATTAHLWFEEYISGDRHEDIIIDVWHHIDRAEWFAQAMLEGGQNEEAIYIPLGDPKFRQHILDVLEKIGAFRDIAKIRYANPDKSAAGSESDQRFDAVFNTLLAQTDEVETALHLVMARDIQRFQTVQIILLVLCFLLTGIIGVILHRFERRQSINLSKVKASNQQLRAGEQQLQASNQQLRAGEQQLKASNQQLRASEQQLKASNQQLQASEQQLKASNQQLRASDQQLRAINLQLIKSQQKLALHVQNTPLGVIQWNLDFKVSEWNSAAEKIFGYTEEEAIGRHAVGLIISESVKEITDKVWQELLDQKGGAQSINPNITKDNKSIMCEWYNTPLIDDNGKTIGVASLVMDITERKRAVEKLKESESKNRAWLENSPVCTKVLDLDFNLQYMSIAGVEALNIDDITQYYGKPYPFSFYPDSFKKPMTKNLAIAKETGKTIVQEAFVVDTNGKKLWFHSTIVPINDDEGRLDYIMVLSFETTKRRQAEEELAKSETNYRSTVENLLVGVVVHASDSSILLSNPEASRILGLTAEQMLGKAAIDPAWCFVYEDSSVMKIEDYPVSKVIATKKSLHRYVVGIKKPDQDNLTWVNVSAIPILSKDDELEKIVINFIDVTETKRLQALESRAERLEMAGTVAGQVAHDFNNLLAPIVAYPDFIRDELPADHKAHVYLDSIENAALKIANINQDLLVMGRRGHYNLEVLNLNRVVSQAAQEMKSRTKTVTFEMDLCQDIMKIKGGSAQIHRMLTNLLVNAQDAMGDIGQVTIKTENYYADDTTIAFGRVPKGEYVKLTITDNGCGIPDDIIQNILDPFFSTKTADKKRGSGLGLSVVDAVTRDHNGYLDLSSKVGHGTSFYIYFPVTREDSEADDSTYLAGGTEKVLIIDDDNVQREVTTQLLEKLGYETDSVVSGDKAIEFIRENRPDLVLLDMVMPGGIDGVETYRQILEINPGQKAIILSGFSESERVLEAQKLGAGAFIKKPVTRKIIAAAVRTELDRKIPTSNS